MQTYTRTDSKECIAPHNTQMYNPFNRFAFHQRVEQLLYSDFDVIQSL